MGNMKQKLIDGLEYDYIYHKKHKKRYGVGLFCYLDNNNKLVKFIKKKLKKRYRREQKQKLKKEINTID